MSIVQAAKKISTEHAALSNIYRVVTLAYLTTNDQATWSDIRRFIETNLGSVNPNTLHFHLKALLQNGFISTEGSQEKPVYRLGELPPDIKETIASMTKVIKSA